MTMFYDMASWGGVWAMPNNAIIVQCNHDVEDFINIIC